MTDALPNIVEFRNVTKRFGDLTVIRDVTFAVPDLPGTGEFVTILGPSNPPALAGSWLAGGSAIRVCPLNAKPQEMTLPRPLIVGAKARGSRGPMPPSATPAASTGTPRIPPATPPLG